MDEIQTIETSVEAPETREKFRIGGKLSLAICVSLIVVMWLIVLPRVAEHPRVKSRLDWLDERNISPSAMYYTELESMDAVLQQQIARQRQQRIDRRKHVD